MDENVKEWVAIAAADFYERKYQGFFYHWRKRIAIVGKYVKNNIL